MALSIFPLRPDTYPAFPVKRKPTYATIEQVSKQGREVGSAQQNAPLWEFELTYEVLRDNTNNIVGSNIPHLSTKIELQRILQLFLSCASQFGEFLFLDWTDNSREDQPLGTGDGLTTVFPFVRTITGAGGLTFTEQVGAVNLDDFSVVVKVDGVEVAPGPSTWNVSDDLLSLVFVTAPAVGAEITSTFHYYYRCRWISDYQEVEQFVQFYWEAKSVRFRSVNPNEVVVEPIEITPINPPNPPTPTLTNCLHDFQWLNHPLAANDTISPSSILFTCPNAALDQYGHLYIQEGNAVKVYNSDGTVAQTFHQNDLADAIDAWYGSPVVNRIGLEPVLSTNTFTIKPIINGQYLIAYLGATTGIGAYVSNWFVALEAQSDGSLNAVGACRTFAVLGPPFGTAFNFLDAANGRGTGDCILYIGGNGFGGSQSAIGVLPSIDEMSTPMGVDPFNPCTIPVTVLFPIGDFPFSQFLDWGSPNSRFSGFLLPNSADETILYCYFNRGYMEWSQHAGAFIADRAIRDTVEPVHPHGAMIKVNLGELDFDTLSTTHISGIYYGRATDMYVVDNANWLVGGIPAIPFPDEFTYISHGNNAGGTDCYQTQPAAVVPRGGDKWWVIFFLPGISDANFNRDGKIYESFRIFEYDAGTEVATQILKDTCLLHYDADVPLGPVFGNRTFEMFQNMTVTDEDDGSVTLTVNGAIYQTRFYNFTP